MSTTYGTASSITIPSDGDTIDAADVNTPLAALWDQHDTLADLTALTAILVPTHGLMRHVRGYGHYVFVTSGTYSATTANSPYILASGDGTPGRWVYDGIAHIAASITVYRRVTRPPPYISAGTALAGDTAFTTVVAPTPTTSYALKFLDVYVAGAEGKIMYFPLLDLHDGMTITAATVNVTAAGAHAGLPALMPGICVIRREVTTGTISSLQSGGFVLDSSAGLGAYEAAHDIATGAAIDQNNTVDTRTYEYFLLVQNEGHTNALLGLAVNGAYITATAPRYQR